MIRILIAIASLLATSYMIDAQETDTINFETFEYQDGDQTFQMQKYFLVFLKKGPNSSPNAEAAARMQKAHLAYLGHIYNQGYICMNGPFGDDGMIRGATIYRVATAEDAERLASGDPAVKAGIFELEIHPWWLARGTGVR
mgnify:CR=1 FL=1